MLYAFLTQSEVILYNIFSVPTFDHELLIEVSCEFSIYGFMPLCIQVSDFGALWISEFLIRNMQPAVILVHRVFIFAEELEPKICSFSL